MAERMCLFNIVFIILVYYLFKIILFKQNFTHNARTKSTFLPPCTNTFFGEVTSKITTNHHHQGEES